MGDEHDMAAREEYFEALLRERDERIRKLEEAARAYAERGLALQQAVGRYSMRDLEEMGLFETWDMACFKHGELMELLGEG